MVAWTLYNEVMNIIRGIGFALRWKEKTKKKMRNIKVSTLFKILLYIIVIGCENCFYLVDADAINVAGVINYTDLFIVLAALFFVAVFLCYRDYPTPIYRFKWLILAVIVLSIISSVQSNVLYGQSFIMGLRPQRFWMVWGLLYFPIRKLLYINKLSVDDLIKMIFIIGTCEIILYSAQYVLGNEIAFLHVDMSIRYGQERYYFYNILLRLLLFINLDRIFNRKKIVQSAIYIVAILFILLVVGKMRMTSMATLVAIAFGIFVWKKGKATKLGIFILALVAGIVLLNTSIVQDTIGLLIELQSGNVSSQNVLLRQAGQALYLNSLKHHPIIGCGFISSLNSVASEAAGLNESILLVDNGLWAFVFMYGALGAIWAIYMFCTFIINGWKVSRNKNVYFIMLAPLGWLVSAQTEAHWYWENGFICVVLILVILEEYVTKENDVLSQIIQRK